MVRAANKLPNTILALTKSDLVRSEFEIVERIFDRVLGTSSEHQHLVGLAGCVAVANRNHTDHLSLVEADVEERCCFQAMLDDPAEAYAPMEVQQKLRDNMTIKKLILKLDSLFHNFIVQRWKPAALTFLAPLKEHAQVRLMPSPTIPHHPPPHPTVSLSAVRNLLTPLLHPPTPPSFFLGASERGASLDGAYFKKLSILMLLSWLHHSKAV